MLKNGTFSSNLFIFQINKLCTKLIILIQMSLKFLPAGKQLPVQHGESDISGTNRNILGF